MSIDPTTPDCTCHECGHVFPLPAVAKCPQCNSNKLGLAQLTDDQALNQIADLFGSTEFGADTYESLRDILAQTGRSVYDDLGGDEEPDCDYAHIGEPQVLQ